MWKGRKKWVVVSSQLSKSIREWTQDCLTETVPDTRLSHRDGPFKVTRVPWVDTRLPDRDGPCHEAVSQRRSFRSQSVSGHKAVWPRPSLTQGCLKETVLSKSFHEWTQLSGCLIRLSDRDGPFKVTFVRGLSAVWPKRSLTQGCLKETVLSKSFRDTAFRARSIARDLWPQTLFKCYN